MVLTVDFLHAGKRQAFQGIGDGAQMAVGQMQVYRGLFQIAVTQQNLNGAQVGPRFQQMRGEAMATMSSEDIGATICPS